MFQMIVPLFISLLASCLSMPAWGDQKSSEQVHAGQSQPKFDLLVLQVDGNTILEQQLIEKTVYPFLGYDKSIDDVESARQALEAVYKEQGYPTVLVEIPEQDVVEGQVRLQVMEGTIERLKITGSRYFSLGKIREQVPALAAGQVPHMPDVQEQVAALGKQSGDRQVTPIFRAGSTPGKTEVELRVADTFPLHGSLEIHGNNPEGATRPRLVGTLRYDNLWQRFHSASFQYQVTPENPSEIQVWSGTYVMPTGFSDTRLAMYGIGIDSNTKLGTPIGGLTVVGAGTIYGARLTKPLATRETYNHNLVLGFDYKNFDQAITVQGQDENSTPISYTAFQLSYDGNWRYNKAVTSFNAAANFAVRGLGNETQEFEDRRFKAQANYAYLTLGVRHLQELPGDFRVAVRTRGQVTNTPLISNEQFSVGGHQSVRGYHMTQQLGDHGVNFSVELQSPMLQPTSWEIIRSFRPHIFFDYAALWIKEPLPRNPDFYKLAGAGAGFRMQLHKFLSGEFDWAYPLYRQGKVDVGDQRFDFRLNYEF